MSEVPEEVRWVQQAREGSEWAVTRLVNSYAESLTRYINCILDDESSAEEIAQLAFVRAFGRLKDLQENAAFRNWLWKIGRCAALDFRRTLGRGTKGMVDNVATEKLDMNPSEALSADLFWERENVIDVTRGVIKDLPPDAQDLLTWRYGDNLTLRQIGDRTGETVSTVKARLARLRSRLRPRLDKLAGEWKRLRDELP